MVCQAAGQTRFRASKHEIGVAGSSTIIVRVIACFQPLQDCQPSTAIRIVEQVIELLVSLPQSIDMNKLSSSFNLAQVNDTWPFMSPCANIASQNETLHDIVSFRVLHQKQCQPEKFHGSFYGLPQYDQIFNDVENNLSHERTAYFSRKNHDETDTAYPGLSQTQKRFLVFDQSGDQTTVFYTPGIGPPIELTSVVPKANYDYNMVKTDTFQYQKPNFGFVCNEKQREDTVSEMHEDTEEINALLYSDDDYCKDEEEASTGHSPSTKTNFDIKRDDDREEDDEVASNFGPNKRIKSSNGGFEMSLLTKSASSASPKFGSECKDDAESSCGDGENLDLGDFATLRGTKRSMKDHIIETVSLLQSLMPGEKGKDKNAILVLDEVIDYLTSLKEKSQALGIRIV